MFRELLVVCLFMLVCCFRFRLGNTHQVPVPSHASPKTSCLQRKCNILKERE